MGAAASRLEDLAFGMREHTLGLGAQFGTADTASHARADGTAAGQPGLFLSFYPSGGQRAEMNSRTTLAETLTAEGWNSNG